MSIKFVRASSQYLSSPDHASFTYPNGDWALGFAVVFDGLVTGDNPQYLISNDNFTASGSMNVVYHTSANSNPAAQSRMTCYIGSGGVNYLTGVSDQVTSGAHYYVLQRSGTTVTLRRCPILASSPSDASAVVAVGHIDDIVAAWNGSLGLFIGARPDLAGARFCDQSMARVFRFDGTLTDLEVARLAYGEEITDLGHTPAWYVKMEDNADLTDHGASSNVFTKTGSPATGTSPGFGYTSAAAPVITGTPAIIGTPYVGTACSFTPASVTGTPTPTRTYQWRIDGVDISGATSATYTPVSGDATKTLTIKQTETNASGTANATSSGVVVSAALAAPVITGTPSVIGTPTVGSASSFTPASVTGNPTPTRTYQWKLDGTDVSGATGATYTPISGDVGKSLSVRQIETNSQGTANATSSGVTVVTASGTVDVTQITAERIFQRGSGVSAIPMSGTYTGTAPASLEYQLYAADGTTVLVAWAALTGATISGGTWSKTPDVPQGGMYRLAVRSKDGGGTVIATSSVKANLFGVGDLIGYIGSSSAEKQFNSTSGTGFTAAANVRRYFSSSWSVFSTDGSAIPLANALASQAGVPVGMVSGGVGGTTLIDWINTSSSQWVAFVAIVAAVGGKLAGVITSVGSNDAASGVIVSRAQHLANLRELIANCRSITSQATLKVMVSGFNRRLDGTWVQFNFCRMAENDVGDDSNVYHVQTLDFEMAGDGVHLTPAGFTACADRLQYVFGLVLNGGTYRRGPKITAFNASGSSVVATLAHRSGTDISPSSAISNFSATDASGVLTITGAVRTSATSITVSCNRTLVAPVVARYQDGGTNGPGNVLMDNGTVPLPAHVETDLPTGVSSSVSSDLSAAYAIAATISSDLAAAYNIIASVSKDLAAAYALASAGLYLSDTFYNNTTTLIWVPGTAVSWTWTVAGRVGSMSGKTVVDGTGALNGASKLSLSALPVGAGQLDVAVLGASTLLDSVYREYGTVT